MGITVTWDDDARTRILLRIFQRWTWDEIRQARAQVIEMIETHAQPISLIVSSESENWVPSGYAMNMREIVQTPHPNIGQVIFVLDHSLFRMLFENFASAHPVLFPFQFTQNMDEARLMAQQYHKV